MTSMPTEEEMQASLERLKAKNPDFDLQVELGALLMRPLESLTLQERERYDWLHEKLGIPSPVDLARQLGDRCDRDAERWMMEVMHKGLTPEERERVKKAHLGEIISYSAALFDERKRTSPTILALKDIAEMPEHDQDDAHRLRHKAKIAYDAYCASQVSE